MQVEEDDLDDFLYGSSAAKEDSSVAFDSLKKKSSKAITQQNEYMEEPFGRENKGDDEQEKEEEESSEESDYEIVLDGSSLTASNAVLLPESSTGQQPMSLTAISTAERPSAATGTDEGSAQPGTVGQAGASSATIAAALIGYVEGIDIHSLDIDTHQLTSDKPWRKPGADITDYFNYGFTELTWKAYCAKQKMLREEYKRGGEEGLGSVNVEMVGQHVSQYYSQRGDAFPQQQSPLVQNQPHEGGSRSSRDFGPSGSGHHFQQPHPHSRDFGIDRPPPPAQQRDYQSQPYQRRFPPRFDGPPHQRFEGPPGSQKFDPGAGRFSDGPPGPQRFEPGAGRFSQRPFGNGPPPSASSSSHQRRRDDREERASSRSPPARRESGNGSRERTPSPLRERKRHRGGPEGRDDAKSPEPDRRHKRH